MPQTVEMPDGIRLEFPDEMSRESIRDAIKSKYVVSPEEDQSRQAASMPAEAEALKSAEHTADLATAAKPTAIENNAEALANHLGWAEWMVRGVAHPVQQTEKAVEQTAIAAGLAKPGAKLLYSPSKMLETPMLGEIPHLPESEASTLHPISSKGRQIGRGVINATIDFVNLFQTPEGAALLGTGQLPAVSQKALARTFAVQLATQSPLQLANAVEQAKAGNLQAAAQEATAGAGGLLMARMIENHNNAPTLRDTSKLSDKVAAAGAPATAEALKETAGKTESEQKATLEPEPASDFTLDRLEAEGKTEKPPQTEDLPPQTAISAPEPEVLAPQHKEPAKAETETPNETATQPRVGESGTAGAKDDLAPGGAESVQPKGASSPSAETGISVNEDIPADLAAEIEKQKTGSGPLTVDELKELNELHWIRQERGKLGMLNSARLEHLEAREKLVPAAAKAQGDSVHAEETISGQKYEYRGDLKISTLGLSNEELGKLSEVKRAMFAEDQIGYQGASRAKVITKADKSPPKWFNQQPKPEPPKAGAEGEIIGMGGAVPGEFVPSGRETGVKNAAVDAERQSRGLEPMLAPERLKNSVVWDRVMARIDREPEWQDTLIEELKESPRTPSQDEIIALDHRYVDLQNEYAKATRDGAQAYRDGRIEDVDLAKARTAFFEGKLNELEHVAKRVGTEWGRSGQMRQRVMKEDFTLAAMEARRRAAHGFEPLSEAEHAEILKDFNEMKVKLQAAQEAEAAATEKAAKAEMDKALAEARAQVAQGPSYAPGVLAQAERFAKRMDKAGDDALARLKARLGRTSAGVDPLILSDAAIYAAAKITRGLVDTAHWISELGEWSREHIDAIKAAGQKVLDEQQVVQEKTLGKGFADKVKKAVTDTADEKKSITDALADAVNDGADEADVGRYARALAENYIEEQVKGGRSPNSIPGKEITEAVHRTLKDILPEMTDVEARDAWTQYGKYKSATSDPVRKRLIQASEEERKLSTLERLQKGEPGLKTGQQRVEATDLSRRRTKEINELNKKLGIRTTDLASQLRSTLDAIHTRNKNRIADLRFENATRRRIVRNKAATPSDAESIAQRAEIDRLKKENDVIFGDKTLTPEQRLARAIALAERNAVEADAALARAKKGDYSKPTGPGVPASAALDAIKAKAKAAREEIAHLKDLDTAFQDAKALKDQTRQLGEIDQRIEEVTRQINEGDIEAKKAPAKPLLAELAAKRGELADLNKIKQQLRNAAKPKKTPAEIALQARKTALANEMAFLQDRLAKGDFSPRRKSSTPVVDPDVAKAHAAVTILREKFNRGTEAVKNQRLWDEMNVFQKGVRTAANTYDAARMLLTTGEFSFVLRQGKFNMASHPIRTARAIPDAIRAMRNPEVGREIELRILNHPDAPIALKDKLAIIDEGVPLSAQEEFIMGRWADRIPVVAAFNRAARVFLNKIRFDTWQAMRRSVSHGGEVTPEMGKAIAAFVNESTGRGSLGKSGEPAAVLLSRFMFSPRYFASRIQYAVGHSLWMESSARTRAVIAMEYGKTLVGLALYYSLLKWYFTDKDKDATIETDPRSADFSKVRIGNTRIEPLAGMASLATFTGRTISGQTKGSRNQITEIRGKVPYGKDDWYKVAGRFARTKFHPVPGIIVNLLSGTDLAGNAVTPEGETMKLGAPITYVDIYQALKEQGLEDGTVLGILAFLGEGLQTYKKKK